LSTNTCWVCGTTNQVLDWDNWVDERCGGGWGVLLWDVDDLSTADLVDDWSDDGSGDWCTNV
jgi:hypothetical protein